MAIINDDELMEDVVETLMANYDLTLEEANEAWLHFGDSIIESMYMQEETEIEYIASEMLRKRGK